MTNDRSATCGTTTSVVLIVLRLVTVVVARRRIRIELIRRGHLSDVAVLIRRPVGASTVASNVSTTGAAVVTVNPTT